MSQEIEIEFKNIITKEEYKQLMLAYNLSDENIVSQTNYYFDTENMDLKNDKCALRIRKKDKNYVLTLKEPHDKGLLETHQVLSNQETVRAIGEGRLPESGHVITQLNKRLNKDTSVKIEYLGQLITERIEYPLPEGVLVLDKSFYFDCVDYELEFECNHWEKGMIFFYSLLDKFSIPKRETENKIIRFYQEKIRKNT